MKLVEMIRLPQAPLAPLVECEKLKEANGDGGKYEEGEMSSKFEIISYTP